MNDADKLALCRGCRDDFYNDHNNLGVKRCWSLAKAKKVRRWKLGWWTSPVQPGAFVEVETLSCHHEPGRYAFSEKLPAHAVEPVRLPKRGKRAPRASALLAFIALAIAVLFVGGAQGQPAPQPTVYVFPLRPPGVDLWPAATYPVNCRPAGVREANDKGGIVTGVIRSVGERYEVLSGGGDLADIWTTINPQRPPVETLRYYRVGPCGVGGHGHGIDAEVGAAIEYVRVVHGVVIKQHGVEHIDTMYYPVDSQPWGIRWLRHEHSRLTGGPPAPEPTPSPPPVCRRPCVLRFGVCDCPAPSPTPSPSPAPTAAPPQPTPCAACPPPVVCPQCPRFELLRVPVNVAATIKKGLSSLGRKWAPSVAEAKAWWDEHTPKLYVPSVASTGQIGQTIAPCEAVAVTEFALRECRERTREPKAALALRGGP